MLSGGIPMNRPLPAPVRDWALLLARVIIGVVMFAHGYQKLVIKGISRTTEGFENMSIPLAIVSASFVTVVEFVAGALLIVGALTTISCGLMLVIMVGAGVFVHFPHGIFIADGGWELIGVIAAGLVVFAAVGPGRLSIDHVVTARQRREREALEKQQLASSSAARPTGGLMMGDG
jgi:putative oxidoreductase